jgi:CRP-like cAMP-binding protein
MVTFLAALGVSASESVVAQWLALIPVLAIEIGSALAGVLVSSLSHLRVTTIEAVPVPLLPSNTERDKVASQLLSHLRANGGALLGSHRVLARELGADRNTVSRALNSLEESGLVAVATSKAGTALRLVG